MNLTLQLRTLGERLAPTIINAEREKEKYAIKGWLNSGMNFWGRLHVSKCVRSEAQWTSYALNIAIGLQVLLGALTTGISAALSSKQVGLK